MRWLAAAFVLDGLPSRPLIFCCGLPSAIQRGRLRNKFLAGRIASAAVDCREPVISILPVF